MEPAILVLVDDLIFRTKIASTAKSLGLAAQFVRTAQQFSAGLTARPVPLAIVDLNANDNPLEAVRIACSAAPRPRIVAYLSHVQADLARAAREAGADAVMARSAFTQELPAMLEALVNHERSDGVS